jgi:hypothetical protein
LLNSGASDCVLCKCDAGKCRLGIVYFVMVELCGISTLMPFIADMCTSVLRAKRRGSVL